MSSSTRRPVPLTKSYRLLNHGPTVLVSAAHEGKRNIMAAAWSMPVEFDPPKVAVVLDKSTWTRILLEASGYFVLNVPVVGQADITYTVGSTSGRDLDGEEAYGLETFEGEVVEAPLLAGCAAWLECRLLPEPHNHEQHDLFLGEVVAAQADERVFKDGRWSFEGHDELRTAPHHWWPLSGGWWALGWPSAVAKAKIKIGISFLLVARPAWHSTIVCPLQRGPTQGSKEGRWYSTSKRRDAQKRRETRKGEKKLLKKFEEKECKKMTVCGGPCLTTTDFRCQKKKRTKPCNSNTLRVHHPN
jgi:flavin reductase (DIM6/NTAB) family NADH-FMN oxidoreductase RutF